MSDRIHGNARLSASQVRAIRKMATEPCACCGFTPSRLNIGRRFGLSGPAVHHIIKRRNYAGVSDKP